MKYQCIYCELELFHYNDTNYQHLVKTIDHFIPKCRGGTDNETNLLVCCRFCNHQKGYLFAWTWLSKLERGIYDHPRKVLVITNLITLIREYKAKIISKQRKKDFFVAQVNATRRKIRHPDPSKRSKRKEQGFNQGNEFVKRVDERIVAENKKVADALKNFVKKK
jgi:hypothetical protein